MTRGGDAKHKGTENTRPAGFCAEEELLTLCVRPYVDAEAAVRLSALIGGHIDWDHVLVLARTHRVVPLVYWSLRALCRNAVPSATMHTLEDHFRRCATDNLYLWQELLKIIKLFEANGVPVIPFKGLLLAREAYGNVALRQLRDLDLLIEKRDLLRAKELLLSIGYESEHQLNPISERLLLRSNCSYELVNRDRNVFVDVHWDAVPKELFRAPPPADLFRDAKSVPLHDTTVLIPSPEHLLLISCLNGAKADWRSLRTISDLAAILHAYPQLDWQPVMRTADTLHCRRVLFLGLVLATDLLGAALPHTIVEQMRTDRSAVDIARDVQEQLFKVRDIEPNGIEFVQTILRLEERLRDKARALRWFAFTPAPEDYKALPLPAPLIGFYYFIRPLRLAGRYGSIAAKAIFWPSLKT